MIRQKFKILIVPLFGYKANQAFSSSFMITSWLNTFEDNFIKVIA